MKRIFAIGLIFSLCFACKPGVPKDLIQPDQMEKVLYDIHLADGYIGAQGKPDTVKIVASSYYKGIYNKFKIDSATYVKSLNYYYNNPVTLSKMYENIIKQLENERKRNDKRIEIETIETQRKNLAKSTQVFDVSKLAEGRPKFEFSQNPFSFL
jgi:hypothetical protein